MTNKVSRRAALKYIAAGVAASGVACSNKPNSLANNGLNKPSKPMTDKWANTHDRTWLGGEYWANPMEDWQLVNGFAECASRQGNRSVHSLTHRLENTDAAFSMSVNIVQRDNNKNVGGAGFRLGVSSDIDEYKSSCFVQRGLDAGIIKDQLSIAGKRLALSESVAGKEVTLELSGTPQAGAVSLVLSAKLSESNKKIGELRHLVPASEVQGNVAVVSNFTINSHAKPEKEGNLFSFGNWQLSGEAFSEDPSRKFGPVLWTMYTLNNTRTDEGYVMKMSAFTGPMGEKDSQTVILQIQQGDEWSSLAESKLDPDVWVAHFRIANWQETKNTPFRVVYNEKHRDGSTTPDVWQGIIRANPEGRSVKMAALTCQNDYSYPYAPVADNVKKLNPDIVFFSGDQIYESHGGFGIIRHPFKPSLLNYLRKFYQFGWAFGEVMRDQPTVCLPDDHDVMQGNLWGQGGQPMKDPDSDPNASLTGGYIHPIPFVNLVHKTTVGHHPDPYNPNPTATGVNNYYSDMVYGNVGFAILADRLWKSGPEDAGVIVGETGVDESPTFINPKINPPNSQLLGGEQEAFLEKWGKDWRGHTLKAVLSQTVFAQVSTHQPTPQRFLKYDFDSSGWPGPARDRAVEIMRESKALHICGDTHLTSLVQYGVDKQRDSNWSFCTPAISAGWPRWWVPDQVGIPHKNRPSHGLAQTGEYLDSFGNEMYVYAVGIPEVGKSENRYVKAHEKGSGFGVINFDTEQLTYTMEAYRYLIDATDGNPNNQFPGWPVTIHKDENGGDNKLT